MPTVVKNENNQGGNAGGAGNEDGGASGDENTNPGKKAGSNDTVSRADHERALADMHKYKGEAAKLKKEAEDRATAAMKEQNQWKELAELKENEAKAAKEEKERIQNSFLGERKYSTVKEKCKALGLRAEAESDLEMLDLESVTVETTSTGKINILGAEKFAERLKTLKPHWFSDKSAPNVNTNGARIQDNGGAVTIQEIIAAEKEGKKSGDMTKYYNLHKKFQTQRSQARR